MAQTPVRSLDDLLAEAEGAHRRMLATLVVLDRQVGDSTHSARLVAPWNHFVTGIRAHFAEEEASLFPALRAAACGSAPPDGPWTQQLAEMERELDQVRTIADALREAARDAGDLEQPLLDLLDTLEVHATIESEALLPAAWAALARQAPGEGPPRSAAEPAPVGVLRRTLRHVRAALGTLHRSR